MHLIDLHCDTVMKLMEKPLQSQLYENNFCVDIKKLQKANAMAQFFALFVELDAVEDPLEYGLRMADKFHMEIEKNKEYIALATNYETLMENHKQGKISAFLTVEEGAVIKGKLEHLRNLYRLGVRLITLTWNFPNEIGFPNAAEQYRNKGLTEFGIEVVKEMNKLGMLIDVSHLSDGGFYDVAKYSQKPFIASHSDARALSAHPRNLTDEMIKIIAQKGGVIGINFEKRFLGNDQYSKIEDMVKHIQHMEKIGGREVISIGTDFDGISNKGLEIQNIAQMDKLIDALRKNGFSEEAIEKIYYKNALRVIQEVL